MNSPSGPSPVCEPAVSDSLTVDLVVADEGGGTTVLPADPEALARFLSERRQHLNGASTKQPKPES